MAKYIFTRDNSGTGVVKNTKPAPVGMVAPAWIYLTKEFKKGEIVDGTIALENLINAEKGDLLVKVTSGLTTTNGVPYPVDGDVQLGLSLNNGALQLLDSNPNPNSNYFTSKNIFIVILIIAVIWCILKL